jgi:hypothetical protein
MLAAKMLIVLIRDMVDLNISIIIEADNYVRLYKYLIYN